MAIETGIMLWFIYDELKTAHIVVLLDVILIRNDSTIFKTCVMDDFGMKASMSIDINFVLLLCQLV